VFHVRNLYNADIHAAAMARTDQVRERDRAMITIIAIDNQQFNHENPVLRMFLQV